MHPTHPSRYRRTLLPPGSQARWGWLMLGWLAVISSPFLGFWLRGRVDGDGVALGLKLALLPLAGIVYELTRAAFAWRAMPKAVRDEYRIGRLVPATGVLPTQEPFVLEHGRERIEFTREGVSIAPKTLLQTSLNRVIETSWFKQQAATYFVAWDQIDEWQVHEDSDSPDFHRLTLRDGGYVSLARIGREREPQLLDAVRALGQRPVRLFCDVG